MFSLNVWQQVAFWPEPQIWDSLQQSPWIPEPTTSLPPSDFWPGEQQATGSPRSSGTMRSGGQHTYGDSAVRPPIVGGSMRAHRFGRLQHVRFVCPTGPVGHDDSFFLQHRSCDGSAQNVVDLLQHFLPHSSWPLPHRLQSPVSGFAQRQFGWQQFGPQRALPPGHFGMHTSTFCPPSLKRTHSVPFGQHTPLQICWSGGHGVTQMPLKQTSCV
jgi:hypothetical protein